MATHLADTSALARLQHDDVAARVSPLFLGGEVATCALVDLDVLATARSGPEHAEVWAERLLLPRVPLDEAVARRAIEVQGLLAAGGGHRRVGRAALLVAAAAERAGLVLLHYDEVFDRIAAVTGQAAEWVVPAGTVP